MPYSSVIESARASYNARFESLAPIGAAPVAFLLTGNGYLSPLGPLLEVDVAAQDLTVNVSINAA